jgi:6-bladed beta-propeller
VRRRDPGPVILLGLSLAAVACETPPEHASPVARSDSAGIALVVYGALPSRNESRIQLSTTPQLVIGGAGGPQEVQFFQVAGVVRLSDGRVVVADGGAAEIRVFDPEGRFIHEFGGTGEGPGEFVMLSFLARMAGDSILAGDAGLGRIQAFDPEGHYAWGWSVATRGARGRFPNPVGVTSGGQVLATLGELPSGPSGGEPERLPEMLLMLDRTRAAWDTLDVLRGPSQVVRATERGFSMQAVSFGGDSDAAAGGDIVAVVDSDVLGARVFRGGRLSTIIRVTIDPVPVTPEMLTRYVDDALALWPAGAPAEARDGFRQRVVNGPHGASLPRVVSVEVDAVGRVWMNLARIPGETRESFAVVGPDGEWFGIVTLPPGLDRGTNGSNGPGLDIGGDYLLGVWRDELGVETVRMYSLVEKQKGSNVS